MKNLLFLFLLLFGLSVASCGGGDTSNSGDDSSSSMEKNVDNEKSADESTSSGGSNSEPANLKEAMEQAQKAMKDAGMGQTVKPVNFRELQKMTPEKLAGMERTSKSGQTAGAIGMNISTAEAKYKDGDGTVYEIKIVDTGGLGMGVMSMAAWSMTTIDKEDDNGYERTATMDGYKSYEKYRKSSDRCEVSIFAHERFVITGECRKCEMDQLKKVIKNMNIDDMKDLKADEEG
ncbi:MAG: hypothetical protein R2788_15755 [Saprospiraceae bacterium]